MIIPGLENLDARTATGIISRLALSIDSDGNNPAARPLLAGEDELRAQLLGMATASVDPSREGILDWLDRAIDEVAPPVNEARALSSLAEQAAIWSDAYDLKFLSEESLRVEGDVDLAKETLKDPSLQEDFSFEFSPALISLFAKWFDIGSSSEFLFIVAGKRLGTTFDVEGCWRVYSKKLVIKPLRSIKDALRKFVDHYGCSFRVGHFNGKFLENERVGQSEILDITITGSMRENNEYHASFIAKYDEVEKVAYASFGMCINRTHYYQDVQRFERRRSNRR